MTTTKISITNSPRTQSGAALVVGLVLLMVLTLLAVSGMNTSSLEVTMAGNRQYGENAFQAAETGLDISLALRNFNTVNPSIVPPLALPNGIDWTQASTTFQVNTPVPDGGYSMGVGSSSFQAFHFTVTAVGTSARNAISTNTQSFYIVGPGGS